MVGWLVVSPFLAWNRYGMLSAQPCCFGLQYGEVMSNVMEKKCTDKEHVVDRKPQPRLGDPTLW